MDWVKSAFHWSRTWSIVCTVMMTSLPAIAQQPLTLHEAIQRALVGPAARVYAAQVAEARGGVRQAGLGPNPVLYLSSEDIRPWADGFSFPNNTEDFGYVGQVFELDGKRGKRVSFAAARLRQSEAQQALRLQQIAGTVAASYWSAALAGRVVDLLHQDVAAMDDMVRYHQNRVDAGAMKGIDLLRIQIERDRIAIALQSAERDAALARVELLRLLGEAPTTELRLTDAIDTIIPIAPVAVEVVLAQRADVRAAHEAVNASEADLKLQRANGVPDPNLLLGYKRNSGLDTGFGSLQIGLPFRNRNQGEVERAHAGVIAAQASLEQVQQQVRADVEAAQQNYEREQKMVQQTLPDMRARAKKNLEILTEAYRIGGVDLLRYIDAERTEIDVEISSLRMLTEYQQSAIRLQLASGVQP